MYVQDLEIAQRKLWDSNHLEVLAVFLNYGEIIKWPLKRPKVFQKSLTLFALLEELGALLQKKKKKSFPNLDSKITTIPFIFLTLHLRNSLFSYYP